MLAVIPYPQIDPFVFRVGNFALSWYATIFLLGFVIGYFIVRWRYRRGRLVLQHPADVSLLATYTFYGVVLGARLFYVLFYNFQFYWENPLEIPAIWHGGLSFHGGLTGAVLALFIFSRRHQASFLQILDSVSLCVPIGVGLGRLANFINGELYGRVTDVPWAMVFPRGGPEPRHPSQLYESFLEGPVLFLILLWVDSRAGRKDGLVAGIFIIAYGVLRFFVEFFREPDPQLGPVLGPFSMGQVLCFLMILFGLGFLLWIKKYSQNDSRSQASSPLDTKD